MVVKDTKISQKIKNKSLFNVEKNIIKWEKKPYYNYKKLLFQEIATEKSLLIENKLKLNVRIFWKIICQAINLLQKANLL